MDKRIIMRVEVAIASKKELDKAILQGLLPSPIQEEIAQIILGNLVAKNGNGRNGHKRNGHAISRRINEHDGNERLASRKHAGTKR